MKIKCINMLFARLFLIIGLVFLANVLFAEDKFEAARAAARKGDNKLAFQLLVEQWEKEKDYRTAIALGRMQLSGKAGTKDYVLAYHAFKLARDLTQSEEEKAEAGHLIEKLWENMNQWERQRVSTDTSLLDKQDEEIKSAQELLDSKKTKEAWDLLRRAAENGNLRASMVLYNMLPGGEEAEKHLQKAADGGWREAQYTLGLNLTREADPKIKAAGLKWLEQAAEKGWVPAMERLGELYYYAEKYDLAMKWLMISADEDREKSHYSLGKMYLEGKGVPKDVKTAEKWFVSGAELGDADQQWLLGVKYDMGKEPLSGCEFIEDQKAAVEWFKKAAEQGHLKALNSLGYMYMEGRGVEKSWATAMTWFEKAAKEGFRDSAIHLANMYSKGGFGLPADQVKTLRWMLSAYGDSDAKVKEYMKSLKPEQVEEARRLRLEEN